MGISRIRRLGGHGTRVALTSALALGALGIIFVLRKFFKLAWKVIRVILILLALLVIFGEIAGFLQINFL